ncbi:cytochrome c [Tsuneonella sp. HG222]
MRVPALAPLLLAVAVTACSKPAPPQEVTVHEIMVEKIDGMADPLWEVTNTALDENAAIDPARLTDAQWTELARLALGVKEGADQLATMQKIVLAKPGVKISDEDSDFGSSAAQVQKSIDANPEDFRNFAGVLAAHMADLAAAAKAHDAAKATPLVDQLDGVCEQCHLEFWYPQDRALVESIRRTNGDDPTT